MAGRLAGGLLQPTLGRLHVSLSWLTQVSSAKSCLPESHSMWPWRARSLSPRVLRLVRTT